MRPVVTAVRLGRLGDLVMTWPALRWLAEDAQLQVVTEPRYAALVAHAVPGARVVAPEHVAELAPADVVLDLHGVAGSRSVLRRLPMRPGGVVLRTDKQSLRRRSLLLPRLGTDGGLTWPQRHLQIAQAARSKLGLAGPQPGCLPRLSAPRASAPGNGPRLGLVLGAGHETKRWPASSFAALARSWEGDVRLFAGPDELALPDAVLTEAPAASLWADPPGRPLLGLCEGLAGCDVVVSGDTGPLHLAGALGVPVVALFGPTPVRAGFWVWGQRGVALQADVGCAPCSMHGARPCRKAARVCLDELSPERVLSAARGQVARSAA